MPNNSNELSKLSGTFGDLVKLGIGEKRKVLELQKITESIGKYIHFSDSDRAGISFDRDIHPGNPRGFYGYPLTPSRAKAISSGNRDAFDEYGHRKYIYVFDVTGNILNLDKFDLEHEFQKLLNYVKNSNLKYKDSISWMTSSDDLGRGSSSYKLIRFVQQIARMMGTNEHSALNSLYRKLGYDAIFTRSGGLGDDITEQIVVLSPSSINIVHKLENPLGLTKEEEEEDKKFMTDLQKKKEDRDRARAKEDEEIRARLAEYEKKEEQRLADRAKYEADRARARTQYEDKMKNVSANQVTSLQSLLKSGDITVSDIETLKELAEVAFLDYAKIEPRSVKQAGILLTERGVMLAHSTQEVIRFLKASTKL
jgi:hypothetical protein